MPHADRPSFSVLHATIVVVAVAAALGGCGGGGEDPGPGPGLRWPVGGEYYAPEYIADGNHVPAQVIVFDYDGTWTHETDAIPDDEGTWTSQDTGTITLDTGEILETPTNCQSFWFRGSHYYRDEEVYDCFVPGLTNLERCLVGDYMTTVETDTSTAVFEWSYSRSRLYVASSIYEEIGDETVFTHVAYWQILAGTTLDLGPELGTTELDADFWAFHEAARTTPRDLGCDESQLPGGACELTCSSGSACAEYEGWETCCPTQFPSSCPDIHWCYADAADRDAACGDAYYGDPELGCEGAQIWLTLDGRDYCAPTCSASGACPSAADGTAGSCIGTIDDGTEVCGVTCTDIGVSGGQCPYSMTCAAAGGGGGLCVW
jgi:hypothetical protein